MQAGKSARYLIQRIATASMSFNVHACDAFKNSTLVHVTPSRNDGSDMAPLTKSIWMWAEACRDLDRAERLHRRFFEPGGAVQHAWEPPVDIIETAHELLIEIALPGVDPRDASVSFAAGTLLIAAERRLRQGAEPAVIRRLELPYGRFERRLPLPAGSFELAGSEFVHGCLMIVLRKVAPARQERPR
jgi:HSP20 family protein